MADSRRELVPLVHGGLDRPYLLQAPPGAGAARAPLLVELHGRGIDAVRFDQLTGFGLLADEEGFALALPHALGEIWNDGRTLAAAWPVVPDDIGYLTAVIDSALARLPIEERRVYIVGMSNGAAMAGRLACELSSRIAAFAQVAGTMGVDAAAGCHPARPIPILNIHGTADDYAPYQGGSRHSLRARVLLRRATGTSVGPDDWARFWAEANGASDGPVVTELPPDTTIRTWRGPTASSDVVFYRVEGAGHTWPSSRFALPAFLFGRTSQTFDATRTIWEFLARHTAAVPPEAGGRDAAMRSRGR
jgi:polyhydroxybutyrate depolymerase